jgi:hypothetical protein
MKLRQVLHRVRHSLRAQQPAGRPKKARRQLLLEGLEDRTVPTVIFNPIFGAQTPAQDGGARLNSPAVCVILWGSYWGDILTQQSDAINQAASHLGEFNAAYFAGLTQYGFTPYGPLGFVAYGGGFIITDVSDPPNGNFAGGDIDDIIDYALIQHESFASLADKDEALFVVVTPPGVQSSYPNAVAFNFVGDYPSVWISTTTTDNNNGGPNINLDQFTWILSHELAGIMTDPGGDGLEFLKGANWNGASQGPQVSDNEGSSYAFREPNGVLVQPYWSAGVPNTWPGNVWIVPDGNKQTLTLNPFWDVNGFTGKYDLTITGDQMVGLGGTADDTITIDSKGGGILVTLNGEKTPFDPGMIRTITINAGAGYDTIKVESTLAGSPVTINGGNDVLKETNVDITPTSQNLSNLGADIQVNGGGAYLALYVHDQADAVSGAYAIGASVVEHGLGGIISYNGINALVLYGGKAGQTYYVFDTYFNAKTFIYCGPDSSTVNVLGTTGKLNILTASSTDVVNISSLQSINGPVTIKNGALAYAQIHIDDSADTKPRVGTLDTVVPAGETLPFGTIMGLAPALIQFQWAGTDLVTITTGKASDTFYVRSTQTQVLLDSAGGRDTVNVGGMGPSGTPGDVQSIKGRVSVSNSKGLTELNVDDSGDKQSKSATITSSLLTGLAPADIAYKGNQLASLTIRGGSGGNIFYVRSTPGGGPSGGFGPNVALFTGSGADTVNVGDYNNTLDGIQGPLVVMGQGAHDTLNVNDQGSNAAHTYLLTSTPTTSTIKRSGAAPITYDNTTDTVIVKGSNGVDTYTVQSPIPAIPVTFQGTGTMNTLLGPNVANTLWQIIGHDAGRLGLVAFSGMQNLVGGGSSNTFHFSSVGDISNTIDGGSSLTNTLDYSATNMPIAVHLAFRYASRIRGGANDGFTRISSLIGGSAMDSLAGPHTTNLWLINGADKGSVGTFQFTGIETLLGTTGVDTFRFTAAGSLSGLIDGFGGGDWLDYSQRTTAVTVNLTAGSATSVAGGAVNHVSRIQHVMGSAGNNTLTGNTLGNILIGGAGINLIKGGSGRSLLIGGKGTSAIGGGTSDDILIAGTTLYDGNEAALMAILKEWQRTDQSYEQRVAALSTGPNKLVWGMTVFDNDAPGAKLMGGGGMDWIFKGPNDP